MDFKRILRDEKSRYIISIILGLGLASLFRKACHDRKCIVFKGASIDKIKDKVYSFGNACYTFEAQPTSCDEKVERVVDFA